VTDTPRRGTLFPDFEITGDDTVLDVGCGAGNDSLFSADLGAAVIALDSGPKKVRALAEAARGLPARSFRAIQTECDPIPLPDGTADVVLCKEVLEHVDEPGRLLAELYRVGRPGARYLITVPAAESEAFLAAMAPAWYFRKPFHQHVFAPGRLDELVREAGLAIERRAACGSYHTLWWAIRFAADLGFDPRRDPHAPLPPLLDDWEALWRALEVLPGGSKLICSLDGLLPKSQVLVARKPLGGSARGHAGGGWFRSDIGSPAMSMPG
jgi:ubiquinone/menaquinone biosynthesis C-methylase UbiE